MTARAWHSLGDWQVGRVDGAWVVLSRSKIVEGRAATSADDSHDDAGRPK